MNTEILTSPSTRRALISLSNSIDALVDVLKRDREVADDYALLLSMVEQAQRDADPIIAQIAAENGGY